MSSKANPIRESTSVVVGATGDLPIFQAGETVRIDKSREVTEAFPCTCAANRPKLVDLVHR